MKPLAALLAFLLAGASLTAQVTVYVVRHAEKVRNGDSDPDLTREGYERARALAETLRSVELAAVYTTTLRRTQLTAAPAARQFEITPTTLASNATRELVERLETKHTGEHVLVVGHSNTVPAILRGLGIERRVRIEDRDYDDHDDLFVVHAPRSGDATLSHLHFGRRTDPRLTYMGRTIARTMHWTGASWLMRETREKEEQPNRMLDALAIEPGMTVCDVGCGSGYHALRLARRVGEKGRVIAVDIQPQMLKLLKQRQENAGVTNIERILGKPGDPKLPVASCDLILCVDVYHEFAFPERMLAAMRRALKPQGRLVLVEFRAEDPDVPIKELHKMSKKQILKELGANGFELAGQFDGLPWQHVMSFGVTTSRR